MEFEAIEAEFLLEEAAQLSNRFHFRTDPNKLALVLRHRNRFHRVDEERVAANGETVPLEPMDGHVVVMVDGLPFSPRRHQDIIDLKSPVYARGQL